MYLRIFMIQADNAALAGIYAHCIAQQDNVIDVIVHLNVVRYRAYTRC